MSYYEDDYDDRGDEQRLEAGWMTSEDVETLRALLNFVDRSDPRPGNKSDAALILLDYQLSTKPWDENDPHLVWAQHLLKEHL